MVVIYNLYKLFSLDCSFQDGGRWGGGGSDTDAKHKLIYIPMRIRLGSAIRF